MKRVTLDLSRVQDPAVRAALQEIIRASTQNVLEDVAQSGAALVTIKNAAANQVPYFTGLAACGLLTLGAAAGNLVQLTAAAKLPAVDGSLLTSLNASSLASGTVPDSVLKSTSFVFVNRNGAAQNTVLTGVFTKMQFTNKVLDPQGAFDAVTNFRYQPLVAGKYLVAATVFITNSVANTSLIMSLFKNGSEFLRMLQAVVGTGWVANAACIVDLNGSTDYVELFGFQNSGGSQSFGGSDVYMWMTAQRIGP